MSRHTSHLLLSTLQHQQVQHQQVQHQQVQLFRHLSLLLHQLCERIAWHDLDAAERRKLRHLIAALADALNTAKTDLRFSSAASRNAASRKFTTKAALRKR